MQQDTVGDKHGQTHRQMQGERPWLERAERLEEEEEILQS